jgi:hypothetical protein
VSITGGVQYIPALLAVTLTQGHIRTEGNDHDQRRVEENALVKPFYRVAKRVPGHRFPVGPTGLLLLDRDYSPRMLRAEERPISDEGVIIPLPRAGV